MFFDPELVVPDHRLSLRQGAIAPWANLQSQYYGQTLECLAGHFDFSLDTPFAKLPGNVRDALLHGSGSEPVVMRYADGNRVYEVEKPFEGVIPNLERRWRETDSNRARDEMTRFQTVAKCKTCDGRRQSPRPWR